MFESEILLFLHNFIKLKSGGDWNRADISQSSHTHSLGKLGQANSTEVGGPPCDSRQISPTFLHVQPSYGPSASSHADRTAANSVFMSVPKDLTPPAAALCLILRLLNNENGSSGINTSASGPSNLRWSLTNNRFSERNPELLTTSSTSKCQISHMNN